jgi:signal transduction histidine kinase
MMRSSRPQVLEAVHESPDRRIREPLPVRSRTVNRRVPGVPIGLSLVVLVAALLACAGDPTALEVEGGALIRSAWLHDSASDVPPPATDPGWREVSLPDWWDLRRRLRRLAGWYRVEFAGPPDQRDLWAAAIEGDWRVLRTVLNGTPQPEALTRRRVGVERDPSVFTLLPSDALVPGTNSLWLRFETGEWRIGHLLAIAVGPAEAVRAHYDRLRLLRVTLPTSFAWFALACSAIIGLLGRWDPKGSSPWFAAGLLAWCFPMVGPATLLGMGHDFVASTSMHAFPPLLAIGFHRALALRRPHLEGGLLGSIAAFAVLRLLAPPVLIPPVDWIWWFVDAGIGLYLVALGIQAVRTGAIPRTGLLTVGIALAVAAGLHDVASLFARRALVGAPMLPYAPAMVGLGTAVALIAALAQRLSQASQLNREFERRVEQKRRELADSYDQMASLERERAIASERERMMRDMHDGTGGQLVSALAMVETGGFEPSAVADLLREALADLRLTIDSLDPEEPDLLSLLGAARARLQPRLEAHGVDFVWQVHDASRPAEFGPRTALHVLRIFQEAVANALRHADARTITVRTDDERALDGTVWVLLEISDDGRGFEPDAPERAASPGEGRGLGNMRRRAAAIGASLTVTSGPFGTNVCLRLPRAPEGGLGSTPATRPP